MEPIVYSTAETAIFSLTTDNWADILHEVPWCSHLALRHTSKDIRAICRDYGYNHMHIVAKPINECMADPIALCQLDLVKWLHTVIGVSIPVDAYGWPCHDGYPEMLEWLVSAGINPRDGDIEWQSIYGTFDSFIHIMQMMNVDGYKSTSDLYRSGRIEMFNAALSRGCEIPDDIWSRIDYPTNSDSAEDIANWLIVNDYNTNYSDICTVAHMGLPDIVQKMIATFDDPNVVVEDLSVDLACAAMEHGNITEFERLLSNIPSLNEEIHESICSWAKSIQTIDYLVNRGFPLSIECFNHAVDNGDRVMMEHLVNIGCPIDGDSYLDAIGNNDFDTLKWIHSLGVPMHPDALMESIYVCNYDMFQWILEYFSFDISYQEIVIATIAADNLEVLQWVINEGHCYCLHNNNINEAIGNASYRVLEWMVQKIPLSYNMIVQHEKTPELVRIFLSQPPCWDRFEFEWFLGCAAKGSIETVKYILDTLTDVSTLDTEHLAKHDQPDVRVSGRVWNGRVLSHLIYASIWTDNIDNAEWLITVSNFRVNRDHIETAIFTSKWTIAKILITRYKKHGTLTPKFRKSVIANAPTWFVEYVRESFPTNGPDDGTQ